MHVEQSAKSLTSLRLIIGWTLIFAGCSAESQPSGDQIEFTGGNTQLAVAQTDRETAAAFDRKIIYAAELKLVVRDFAATESAVPTLVKQHGGYLARAAVDRTSGEQRSGRWEARIPVKQFDAFLDAVSQLGVPENRSQTARDVTEEYVDLEARIANKKRLEQRILALLERSEGGLNDVIEVERELARVRSEVEQMEGRLRYLADRIELTTVVIIAREQRDYVPPESPILLARIRNAWGSSITSLREVGEELVVRTVFAFPWLVLLAIVLGPPIWFLRRRAKSD